MDATLMIKTAIALLAFTALGGLIMAVLRFAGAERPPSWLAMGHGLLAGSGLTLLLYTGFTAGLPRMAWIGTAILVLAALGGLYLNLAFHDRKLALPKSIVVVHAAIAIVGFALLFIS
jgi:hypothetical protein